MKKGPKKEEGGLARGFIKWLIHGPPSPSTVDVVFLCATDAYLCTRVRLLFAMSKVWKFRDKVLNRFL